MAAAASIDDAKRFFSLLARPGDVFELRGLVRVNGQQHVTSGFFDDIDALVRAAIDRSGKDSGVYVTLNPVEPALLARAPKNKVHRAGSGDTTSDRDVRTRRSILIDVDPVRPAGISSTDAEHDAALALARTVREELASAGWPEPIFASSGNGAHLIYAVDLPVDDGGLVRRVLERMSKRFSTPVLKVDEKVFNPARISKIYGTLTRKGEDTPERPHRIARIIEAPAQLAPVPRGALEALAPETKPLRDLRQKTEQAYSGRVEFDVVRWLAVHLPDARERDWTEGRKWILPVCPFNDEHDRGEAFVVQKHDGKLAAGCMHDSCKWQWKELRARFEPEYAERRDRYENGNGTNGHNGHRMTDREPPPEVLYEDERFGDEIARTEAEIDRQAAADRDPPASAAPKKPMWHRAPDLVAAILERAQDPWISLMLVDDELARVRAGGTVVLIGGSGSGKSSLASSLMVEHAKNVGPAITLSIELPAEELAARIVGIRCDASWEDALRGNVPESDMHRVLALPRLFVLDRRRATIRNLEGAIDAARAEFPNQPILVVVDYAQLLDSKEREARMKVADAFAQIDDVAREKRVVVLALSQMSRASASRARRGEAIGAESADLGAETAAIERFATITLSIGMANEREDGSSAVELSVGKMRMGKGDRVYPMTYYGRSGLWRVAGEAQTADKVREDRDAEKEQKQRSTVELAMLGAARLSVAPCTRAQLLDGIVGRKATKTAALAALLLKGDLVEVDRKQARSKYWLIWTPDRASDAGIPLRQIDPSWGDK